MGPSLPPPPNPPALEVPCPWLSVGPSVGVAFGSWVRPSSPFRSPRALRRASATCRSYCTDGDPSANRSRPGQFACRAPRLARLLARIASASPLQQSDKKKRHKQKLSEVRADFLDLRWTPLAAPLAPPLARGARQGGGVQRRFWKSARTSDSLCLCRLFFLDHRTRPSPRPPPLLLLQRLPEAKEGPAHLQNGASVSILEANFPQIVNVFFLERRIEAGGGEGGRRRWCTTSPPPSDGAGCGPGYIDLRARLSRPETIQSATVPWARSGRVLKSFA